MGADMSIMNTDPPKTHRALCGLRYDNAFGFTSSGPQKLTPTCFNDIILEPLATWVLLLVILPVLIAAVWIPASKKYGKHSWVGLVRWKYGQETSLNKGVTPRRFGKLRAVGNIIYTLLVLAALLMNVLQIVRLALAHRGVGLLPFNLVGIIIALVLMLHPSPPSRSARTATSLALLSFWSLLIAFTAVALAHFHSLVGIEDRKGTEYLLSDESLDVGVQVGLYGIFFLVEAARLIGYALGKGTTTAGPKMETEQTSAGTV
ncbi:unnamed protein product [Tilletia laevis]|uniref:Uncharacterized protein n=3 Tax=Tilletia TaxID=13289 RepID=A0A8X7MSX7_9BASI|nr:hypothetical protein CF336_g3949 [Tilletia laevis]KAE8198208.1 hypothetical protein CF328_g3618 [Tilletia controversa]KAE8261276.1 hypothetical protein A4X03_0g3395 [Tilletia caries]KAE8202929.1 hypothetical protein CF335_g3225 [Tilletia laevis]KAE8247465.1 hypothetical protein A4X06_0g4433 [Tilletia controversa]